MRTARSGGVEFKLRPRTWLQLPNYWSDKTVKILGHTIFTQDRMYLMTCLFYFGWLFWFQDDFHCVLRSGLHLTLPCSLDLQSTGIIGIPLRFRYPSVFLPMSTNRTEAREVLQQRVWRWAWRRRQVRAPLWSSKQNLPQGLARLMRANGQTSEAKDFHIHAAPMLHSSGLCFSTLLTSHTPLIL